MWKYDRNPPPPHKTSNYWPGHVVSTPTPTPSNSSAWRQITPPKTSPLLSLPTGTSKHWHPVPPTPRSRVRGGFPTPKQTNQVRRILWWCFSNVKGVKKKKKKREKCNPLFFRLKKYGSLDEQKDKTSDSDLKLILRLFFQRTVTY